MADTPRPAPGPPLHSLAVLSAEEIDALGAAFAVTAGQRGALFEVIESIAARRVGCIVFSAATCLIGSLELNRIYSSRPESYPTGERKRKRETGWSRHVMVERKVFVGEGALEMAAAFDDQERMQSLGIRSIINVPVVVHGRCEGVLNFGRGIERVGPADVLVARLLGLLAVPAFTDQAAAEG